jgi:hypothetical protein
MYQQSLLQHFFRITESLGVQQVLKISSPSTLDNNNPDDDNNKIDIDETMRNNLH